MGRGRAWEFGAVVICSVERYESGVRLTSSWLSISFDRRINNTIRFYRLLNRLKNQDKSSQLEYDVRAFALGKL